MLRLWDFEGFESQGLRARLCCRKISDSIFWLHFHPTLTGRRNALPKESPKRNIQKEKIEIDKRRKHFFYTFLYLLGEGTNQRYVPRRRRGTQNTRQQNGVVGSTDTAWKRKMISSPFFKRKILFSFTHASSPFPLETSGSFFKFNSFSFYLFIYVFKFIFQIYLFVPYTVTLAYVLLKKTPL